MIRSDLKSMEFNYVFKIVMIGDAGVGKTSLMYKYVYGNPPLTSEITLGVELGSKIIEMPGVDQKVKLHIWDTSGQEKFRSITRSYYRGAAGCVVMYDVTSRRSFYNVTRWLEDVRSLTPHSQSVVMLVGTKTDLVEQRMVATEEGEALAEQEGMLFAETNITENPDRLFEQMGERIYDRRDIIQSGVKRNTVKPPTAPRPLSVATEGCCFLPFL